MDDVSDLVAKQYTDYAYPYPVEDVRAAVDAGRLEIGDPSLYGACLWPEGLPRSDLRILVAGCGTNQAAWLAYTNPGCSVFGIDLSLSSLAHERYLQEKHGLRNLRLIHGNLLELADTKDQYDLVVSTGVLHHMKDPTAGLSALKAVLSRQGVMNLMVYATAPRLGVYLLQDAFRRLGLKQTAEDVDIVKAALASLPPQHPVRSLLDRTSDATHDQGVVDMFLHFQDRSFTVPEVLGWVRAAGLFFQGWLDNGFYYPESTVDAGSPLRRKLEGLPVEEQWPIVESLRVHNLHHIFLACHPQRGPSTTISFDGNEWLDYKPVRHAYLIALQAASLEPRRNGKMARLQSQFDFTPTEAALFAQSNGSMSIQQMRDTEPFSTVEQTQANAALRTFFKRMFERGHMFMRHD